MRQDRDWTDALRDALRDAEAAPPSGGWERLERELAPAPRRLVRRNRSLRIAAAAAAVLILVAAGEWLWQPGRIRIEKGDVIASAAGGGKAAEQTNGPAVQPETASPGPAPELGLTARTAMGGAAAPASQRLRMRGAVAQPKHAEQTASEQTAPGQAAPAIPQVAPQPAAEGQAAPGRRAQASSGDNTTRSEAAGKASATTSARQAAPSHRTLLSDGEFVAYARPRAKASFGLFAGGGVSGSGNGQAGSGRPLMMQTPTLNANGVTELAPRTDYSSGSFRHHQPLSLGLSVRKEFPYGLSLESGVIYTLLRSDVELFEGAEAVGQRLHFVGVPLRLNWQFFERGRFSLYMGAGAMVEKCVYASFGSERTEEPGLQWSVVGAAGAQYRLGGVVGLYFEPEVSYYFTETSLRTARTDSPLTLSLRLGVRLTF